VTERPPEDGSESAGLPEQSDQKPPTQDISTRRSLYRHPLAAVGGALILAGVASFVILLGLDAISGSENPYRSIVTFMLLPMIVGLGVFLFLIAVRIQVVRARKRGERVRFNLRIEPSNPRYMRSLWLFLGLSAVLLVVVAYAGFKFYETSESVAFCGESCHTVMGPQNVTFANSPHARVPCAECHIGSGGSFWVKSKIDGLRQVWKTLTNSYDRPIATPIENLRPAQQTCEECHWPQQFFGDKLRTVNYYRTDEANSPWTITMAIKVGGGNPRTGDLEGIHWHMLSSSTVDYIATDHKRQEIPWVRVTHADGSESIYSRTDGTAIPDPESEEFDIREFDCMDCHNRPSHSFTPPAVSMNLEMAKGTISTDLPFVRKVGLELLNASYDTSEEANARIPEGLREFYRIEYGERYDDLAAEIEQAAETLLGIYNLNFFPEMQTDYRARTNDLTHFTNEGCFRCHTTDMQDEAGQSLATDCSTCHVIVAQGPSENVAELEQDLGGLEFRHPVEIGKSWETIQCTQCHTPAQGY